MKKLGCASCGGTMKKMSKGGMATKAMGPGKQPFAAGIPYFTGAGQTGPESMKKGGTKKEHVLTTFRKTNDARNAAVMKSLPKAQLGSIVKTVTKYAKPVINAAKSAMGYAEPTVKKVADTYKKAKATSYAKKTAGLKRVEDWDAFNQGEYAKKVLKRTGAVVGGGAAVISGLSDKPKKKK